MSTESQGWLGARWWSVLKRTVQEWSEDKVPRLGAALAYYTVFSIVPLLVLSIAIVGLVFGEEAARSQILEQIAGLVGDRSASALKEMISLADEPSTGIVSTVIAFATLLLGASGLFGQLQDALNSIWGVEPKEGRGIWGMIQDRFLSFMAVLGTGFLLLVSLVVSAGLSAVGKWFGGWLPAPELVLQFLNFVISFLLITFLFAMMFKLLPDAHIAWMDVWVGAAMTSLLFTIGKWGIGLYLGKSDVGSAYGAAGSLVIILVWVYYSTQILLFGAEFTQVYANRFGSRIVPADNAVATDPQKGVASRPEASPSSSWARGAIGSQRNAGQAIGSMPAQGSAREVSDQPGSSIWPLSREERWLAGGMVILAVLHFFGSERKERTSVVPLPSSDT